MRRTPMLLAIAAVVAAAVLLFLLTRRKQDGAGAPPVSERAAAMIAHMEMPERARDQKPAEVVKALRLDGSEKLVDVGAGSGYNTLYFARALPRGKVVATEVDPELVQYLRQRMAREGLSNVEVVLSSPEDPGIPADVDVAFVANVIHLVQGRVGWLRRLHDELKPGARLAVIQFDRAKPYRGVPEEIMAP